MNQRGLKAARWAKDAGVSANSIYNFLNGHSDALDHTTYAKLARAAGVTVAQLSGDKPETPDPTGIWVVGRVQGGHFAEAVQWDESEWYQVDIPVPPRFKGRAKALEVRGPSMNLEYPDGSIVVWVSMLDFRPPREGDHVIVYSKHLDDGYEATVKELRIVDGVQWLWPRSTDPQFQAPINPSAPGDDIESVEIVGVVIGGYRPRIV